jgi:membrane-associated phospholipid phosphatase
VIRPPRGDLVVAGVCAVVVVLVTADVLAGGLLAYLDEAISDQQPSSEEAPTWTHVVGVLGNAGVGGAAVVAAAIATMHALLRWWPGVMTFGQLVGSGLVVLALKYAVGREGPTPDVAPDGYPGYYPSGHTATATVAIAVVVFLLSTLVSRGPGSVSRARRRGLLAGAVGGIVVGASTVLGGFHWLSDVISALAIAAAFLVVGFGMAETYVTGPRPRRRTTSRDR